MTLQAANFRGFLPLLHHANVKFVLVGGGAGVLHGLARSTQDLDIVYAREDENLRRLADALRPYRPYPRGAPPGLPFLWDDKSLKAGLNFTLRTTLGWIDLLGEIAGGGGYEQLLPFTVTTEAYGVPVRLVTLERLIQLKRCGTAEGLGGDCRVAVVAQGRQAGGSGSERMSDFTLDEFKSQLQRFLRPGFVEQMARRMLPAEARQLFADGEGQRELRQIVGIIDAMTPAERHDPTTIDSSRRSRIAQGAGVERSTVVATIKQYEAMAPVINSLKLKSTPSNRVHRRPGR